MLKENTIARMFSSEDGTCRFGIAAIPLELQQHAPPAEPFFTSAPVHASSYVMFRLPPGWYGERHPTPFRCLVVCLAGSLRFIGTAGESITLGAGEMLLDEKTTGEGHATEVLSPDGVSGLIVKLT